MKVSILGAGFMGYAAAERLLDCKQDLIVYNRSLDKTKPLLSKGCVVTDNVLQAVERSDCIILFLKDAAAIEDVLFKEKISFKEKTLIQMGTIGPLESISLQKKVSECHGEYFECPVLGSRKEAREGSLILMVGSTEGQFFKWKEILEFLGLNPRYIGEVGKAAAVKLALNQLIASYAVSFSVSLGIILKNNVDVEAFVDILKNSSLHAGMFDKKIKNWLNHKYSNANFSLKNLSKDVGLVLDEAKDKNLSLQSVNAVKQLIEHAIQKGLGDLDYSSLFEAVVNNEMDKK